MIDLLSLNAYKNLQTHFDDMKNISMMEMFDKDKNRYKKYFLQIGGLMLDFSKNRINDETLKLLDALANECGLRESIAAMFRGEKINFTEKRAVLHTALRNQKQALIKVDNEEIMPKVYETLRRMKDFSDALRCGTWLGYTNQVITDIVNIGIGGSDVGALMVCKALKNWGHPRLNMHFV